MKRVWLLLTTAVFLASALSAQVLDCPGAASRTSDVFHFHVQMYRPDTRGFLDAWGINQFASQNACDKAREAAMKRNLAVVDYFKKVRGDNNYEPDRFGTCHADMSLDKTNPRYLTDAQRVAQIRAVEDVRQRVRERLLDAGVTTDNEIFRDVADPVPTPPVLISGPKLVPMPQPGMVQTTYSAADLKSTKAIDSSKPTMSTMDLPLVDVVAAAAPAEGVVGPPARVAATVRESNTAEPAAPPQAIPAAQPAPAVSTATRPVAESAPAPQPANGTASAAAPAVETPSHDPAAQPSAALATSTPAAPAPSPAADVKESKAPIESAEDVADSFVAYETQRIQNVLTASNVIADEAVKSKIYEACMQRIQLLTNLRSLIETSGTKSRLAAEARAAKTEEERVSFVSKLFGNDMKQHWAAKDATDVILAPQPEVDSDFERILRDPTNHYTDQQKRRALYVLLARGQPTEDQQLWLTTVADSFLQ